MKKGTLFIISGPSGVGKGTIRQKVMEEKDLNLVYSVSMTTRQMRPGEKDGVDYYFVSDETFMENVKKGNFLEYNLFVGHSYGTPKDKVDALLEEGKNVLLEIDVNGARQVMEKEKGVVSIFILPPSFEELEKRIRGRMTEKEQDIEGRLERARKEMALKGRYSYCVVNDDLTRASKEVAAIIKKSIA
ncbi:MAG TPA: guanylate kinase [Firmicutes bacterium]|nr:guanylate kinase [Bacillota bacterium]